MRVRVCSGFHPAGRIAYGERFLRAFDKYWPASTELLVYVEEPTPMPRDAERSLWVIPGALEFHNRHADNEAAKGRVPQAQWKDREVHRGYSFRHDAFKFWKQILIPEAAANDACAGALEDGDVLVWLDGDVETIAPVPEDFVERLLGDYDGCYLGRDRSHSEIGFWAVRMNPRNREFLVRIAAMYRTDEVFALPEWHSAYIWDFVRERMIPTPGMRFRNLVRPGLRGHVWPHTELARYTRHDKGWRKGA